MYIYVCKYIYVCIYINIYMYVYTYVYVYMHIHMYMHIHIYVHIYVCHYTCICLYICMYEKAHENAGTEFCGGRFPRRSRASANHRQTGWNRTNADARDDACVTT